MSALVIWVPKDVGDARHGERFQALLDVDGQRLTDLLGRKREVAVEHVGRAFIGRIDGPSGVDGWVPWWRGSGSGIAWHGVVEDFLGNEIPAPSALARVAGMLRDGDIRMADWQGRWAACAWTPDDTTTLVCGATAAPSLWWTEGPEGWAAGSRIRLLLALVGRSAELDAEGATELVAFGSLIGRRSIYAAVSRLDPRTHVAIGVDGQVRVREWIRLGEYLAPAIERARPPEVEEVAARLRESVSRQSRHSRDPLLLLSGGRDSRAIAAAIAASGLQIPVAIGGSPTSPDHVVARQVAECLAMPTAQIPAERVAVASLHPDRLQAWSVLDAGLASLRQAIVHARFFSGRSPIPQLAQPLFHGLGGEIARGFYYPGGIDVPGPVVRRARRALRFRINPGLRLRLSPEEALDTVVDDLDRQISVTGASLSQWLDLYYWQVRCLRWGADLLAAGDVLQWHWTPLLHRGYILDAWGLAVSEKATSRWIERVTLSLSPALASVPYSRALSPWRRLGVGLARDALRPVGLAFPAGALRLRRRRVSAAEGAALRRLWHEVFHSARDPIWPAIIARRELDTLLETDPAGDAAWALATVELAFRAPG